MKDGPAKKPLSMRLKDNMQTSMQQAQQAQAALLASANASFESNIKAILNGVRNTIANDMADHHKAIKADLQHRLHIFKQRQQVEYSWPEPPRTKKWQVLLAVYLLVSLCSTAILLILLISQSPLSPNPNTPQASIVPASSQPLPQKKPASGNRYLLIDLQTGRSHSCQDRQKTIVCSGLSQPPTNNQP